MKHRGWLYRARFWLWALLFVGYSAVAVGVLVIDARDARLRNLSQVRMIKVSDDAQHRSTAAADIAAVYRAQSGMPFSTLPAGSTFQIVWPDGSTETLQILDPASPAGVRPVAGSQLPATK